MTEKSCLEARLLEVGFANRIVCRLDELKIKCGSIVVLCGPNGVGKSTLLKTIANQIPALSGDISINGRSIKEMSRREFAALLAYVPQFQETRRSLSVEEWVGLGRNPHQQWWSWQESSLDRQCIETAMQKTDVFSFRKTLVERLSGGERQRVLVATALAQEPSFLLLDEPTAHLDFRHQLELLELLVQLKQEGLAVLVVLHDLSLVSRIADQVVLLKKERDSGILAASGKVADVLSRENLRQVYGVEMQILKSEDGSLLSYIPESLSEAVQDFRPNSSI